MKKYLLFLGLLIISPICARVSNDRIKGWLELDDIQKNAQAMIQKYTELGAQLKNETNDIMESGIDAADEIADSDPYAALVMYHNMKELKTISLQRSKEIAVINKRFQELSDYVDVQYKELLRIRAKHIRFPY